MSQLLSQSLRPLALATLLVAPALAAPGEGHGWCHLTPWTADAPAQFDFYGWEVELGDHWAFVTNSGDDTVDVYERDGGHWSKVQVLASPSGAYDKFGTALALHGDDVYVGAPSSSIAGQYAGAVFRFGLSDGVWQHTQTIVSPQADPFDRFGESLAVDDGWLAVGVIGGDPKGAIDVLRDQGGTWVSHARLERPDAVKLGHTVTIKGTVDGLYANVFAGDPNAFGHTGVVFHFRVHPFGYQWGPVVQAPVPESNDGYAFDIAFDGEHLVVGSSWEEQLGVTTGVVYVHDVDGEVFPPSIVLAETLRPDPGQVGTEFGKRVALDGDRIAVGAPYTYSNEVAQPGAVYVFRPAIFGNGWQLEDRLMREGGQDTDLLGSALAIAGGQVLAGAWNTDTNGADASGEVVLFSLTSKHMAGGLAPADVLATVESYGEGKPGQLGVPVLAMNQPPVPGESSLMGLSNVPTGSSPLVLWSLEPAAIAFDEGTLLVGQPAYVVVLPQVALLNQVGWNWDVPDDLGLVGTEIFAQALLVDPSGYGPRQTAQSRGLMVTVGY